MKMKAIKKIILTSVAAFGLSMTLGAYAQQHTKPEQSKERAEKIEKMREHAKKRKEMHQQRMHQELKITSSQEPAWNAFIASMQANHEVKKHDRKEMMEMTAPQKMEKMMQLKQERMAKMQTRLASLKTFYAVLTPEQQKKFDQMSKHMSKKRKQMREDRQDKMAKMKRMKTMHSKMHSEMHKAGENPSKVK